MPTRATMASPPPPIKAPQGLPRVSLSPLPPFPSPVFFFFLKSQGTKSTQRRKPPASVVVLASGLRQDPLWHVFLHPITIFDRSLVLGGWEPPRAPLCRHRHQCHVLAELKLESGWN